MNVTNLFSGSPADDLVGPAVVGNKVIVDGRVIPRMLCRDLGERIEFIVDGRFSFTFPREWAYLAASMAAEVGAAEVQRAQRVTLAEVAASWKVQRVILAQAAALGTSASQAAKPTNPVTRS